MTHQRNLTQLFYGSQGAPALQAAGTHILLQLRVIQRSSAACGRGCLPSHCATQCSQLMQPSTRTSSSTSMSTRSLLPVFKLHTNILLKQVLPQQHAARSTMAAFSPVKGAKCGHLHASPGPAAAALKQPGTAHSPAWKATAVAMHTATATLQLPSDTADVDRHHAPNRPMTSSSMTRVPRVQLIYGPMFAGKSTELLQRTRQAMAQKKSVLLVKSALDKRYKEYSICTHRHEAMPCHVTHELMRVPEQLREHYHRADVIAIDEGQFFPDLLEFVEMAANKHEKTVVVAGLDLDYRRKPFGQVLEVERLAGPAGVSKLTAKCHEKDCTRDAVFSMRLTKDKDQVLVGGKDTYVPTCRHHYQLPDTE